jgi:hypothetical protein
MGVLYRIDQRLADEQAYGGCLFGGDGGLLAKAAHDFRVLGIGERASNRVDDLAQISAELHRAAMGGIHQQPMQAPYRIYTQRHLLQQTPGVAGIGLRLCCELQKFGAYQAGDDRQIVRDAMMCFDDRIRNRDDLYAVDQMPQHD